MPWTEVFKCWPSFQNNLISKELGGHQNDLRMNPAIPSADWVGGDLGHSWQDSGGGGGLLPRPPAHSLRKLFSQHQDHETQNHILLENKPARAACVTCLAGSKVWDKQDRAGGRKIARYSANSAESTCPPPLPCRHVTET